MATKIDKIFRDKIVLFKNVKNFVKNRIRRREKLELFPNEAIGEFRRVLTIEKRLEMCDLALVLASKNKANQKYKIFGGKSLELNRKSLAVFRVISLAPIP